MSVAAVSAASMPSQASPRERSRQRAIRRFQWSILVPLILLLAFVLMPVLFLQLYFSFHQWTVYLGSWSDAEYVGLDLFREVLTDPRFGWAVVRSLAFATGSTIGCFVVGFALAYLMRRPFRGQALYYTIFILPMLTVPVVVAYTAEMLLYQSGPINDLISRFSGIDFKPMWLTDPNIALPTVMLLEIWNWAPFSFIILLAGLARADRSRGDPGRVQVAHLLGGRASAPAPRDLPCSGAALPRSDGRVPQDLGAVAGRARNRDRDASRLHLPDDVAVFRDLQGCGDVLSRHAADDRHRLVRDQVAAAGKAVARRHVCRAEGGWLMRKSQRRRITAIVRYALLTGWAIIAAFPIFWMISTSFKPDTQWFAWPPVYFPHPPTLSNYLNVWFGAEEYTATQYAISSQKPLISLLNSTIIAGTATFLSVLFGAVMAYGVSRYRILSETRMFQLLMLRMIPPIVIVAPLSLYYSTLGLLDSMTGLILIYFLTTLPYAVWMTKSFIDEVPREVEQAAEILGASRWRTIFEIVLPLIRSGLVATFLFILILTWSEYLLALIITKTQVTTLPIELSKYQGTTEGRVYGRQAALAVGITIPLMIVGLIIRKHLARGFSFGMVRR
jgi:multiple sugar transport system permease protein